ncbi:hypothetical protein E5161_20545 [Cohnella pontilimi]|uniref:Uncharacterized protein n=1 Tax=Cohnella pontilimi TaxID=2564100 RepID=A0A4V6WEC6_9BACL|nr:hypothetical protein [Cohnella pontilimi]TJY37659.1 hypothetical protein E5161_20545 [Cohnella pontilimi]
MKLLIIQPKLEKNIVQLENELRNNPSADVRPAMMKLIPIHMNQLAGFVRCKRCICFRKLEVGFSAEWAFLHVRLISDYSGYRGLE